MKGTTAHRWRPLCRGTTHVWIHAGSGETPDWVPCTCGQLTYGQRELEVQIYVADFEPTMHPRAAWLLLTLMLVALMLAGGAL